MADNEHTPWRDRPDSLLRGVVLGAMCACWPLTAISVGFFFWTDMIEAIIVTVMYLSISLLATYMWKHG